MKIFNTLLPVFLAVLLSCCNRIESPSSSFPITFRTIIRWKLAASPSPIATQTSSGDYLIAGLTEDTRAFVGKVNARGDSVWYKMLDLTSEPIAIFEQKTGRIAVVTGKHLFITDRMGNVLLKKLWPQGLYPSSSKKSNSGASFVTGRTDSSYFAAEFDISGNILWTLLMPGSHGTDNRYANEAWSIEEISDTGYVVAGIEYYATEPGGPLVLMGISTNLSKPYLTWQKQFYSIRFPKAYLFRLKSQQLAIAGDGRTLLTTTFDGDSIASVISPRYPPTLYLLEALFIPEPESLVSLWSGNNNVVLTQESLKGDSLWSTSFEDIQNGSLTQTLDGGYLIAGKTLSNYIQLIRVDPNGQL